MSNSIGGMSGTNSLVEAGGASSASTNTPIDKEQGQKFGEIWKDIQAKYGQKAEKPREIKKTLGKDDFLKIMITQMKHQDPSKPFDAEQMAAQMAQYASVEQLQNVNQGLSKLANNQQPLERLAMTNLIGKTVTVDRERFSHLENQGSTLGYVIPKDAATLKVLVYNEAGELMFEKEEGKQTAGEHIFSWDGVRKNGLATKSGNYIFKVEAKDSNGLTIGIDTKSKTKIYGISFEGTEPAFLVGDMAQPQKVAMRNVVRIESDGAPMLIPGAQMLGGQAPVLPVNQQAPSNPLPVQAPAAAQVSQPSNAYFAFQKGEGSKPLDVGQISPQAKAALAQYDLGRIGGGFPNGIEENIEKGGNTSGQ